MATTISEDLANSLLDVITGYDFTYSGVVLGYIDFYSGPQTPSPTDAPAGVFLFDGVLGVGNALISEGRFNVAASGMTQLNSAPLVIPTVNAGVFTTARIFSNLGTPIIDTPISLLGGGGGVIVNTLEIVEGDPITIEKIEIVMPASFGTVTINTALRNALLDCYCYMEDGVGAISVADISVYTGAPPDIDDAPTGTLLWQIETGSEGDNFLAAAGGSTGLKSLTPLTATALATGTAGYVRITQEFNRIQGLAGTDFGFDNLEMVEGEDYTLNDLTITVAGF